jgi:hypothetical protein
MNLRALVALGLVGALLWGGWQRWQLRPLHPPDGQLASADPLQTEVATPDPIRMGRWTLTQRARYDITARILGREDYRHDELAELIPEDLALGWGPMSDNRVLQGIEITQSVRFYSWRPRGELPIARQEITEHSANTHVIPADERIRARLARLRVGQTVRLVGALVDMQRDDGYSGRTSLTRADSGAGACEILLVEQVVGP